MHKNLSDEVNAAIAKSETDGGVWLKDLAPGDSLFAITENHTYRIRRHNGRYLVDGHPTYCKEPTPCWVNGSTFGGSMLKVGFVGKGMHLEFSIDHLGTITTSRILHVGVYGDAHE